MWGFLSGPVVSQSIEEDLKEYFMKVREKLGEKMFLEVFFDTLSEEEYLENMNELNRNSMLIEVHAARDLLSKSIYYSGKFI